MYIYQIIYIYINIYIYIYIYILSRKQCVLPVPGCHHNGFVGAHALVHKMYIHMIT